MKDAILLTWSEVRLEMLFCCKIKKYNFIKFKSFFYPQFIFQVSDLLFHYQLFFFLIIRLRILGRSLEMLV